MMFGRKPRADTIYNQLKMLNGYNAVFTSWGNDPYSTDVAQRSGRNRKERRQAQTQTYQTGGAEIQP